MQQWVPNTPSLQHSITPVFVSLALACSFPLMYNQSGDTECARDEPSFRMTGALSIMCRDGT